MLAARSGAYIPVPYYADTPERFDSFRELTITLIKSNQRMVLIKSSHDIQLWHLARCSIMTYGVTLSRNKQDTQSCLEGFSLGPKAED